MIPPILQNGSRVPFADLTGIWPSTRGPFSERVGAGYRCGVISHPVQCGGPHVVQMLSYAKIRVSGMESHRVMVVTIFSRTGQQATVLAAHDAPLFYAIKLKKSRLGLEG